MSNRSQYLRRSEPVADANPLFPGLTVHDAKLTLWKNSTDETDCGRYWTATDSDGIHWLFDGADRMAVLPSRAYRFYRNGIATRCHNLLTRYLHGELVPVPVGGTVINFGANVGELAVTLDYYGARVIAIEPDPFVLPTLKVNAMGRAIEIIPVAAWNNDQPLKLYLKTETADSSAFNPSDRHVVVPAQRIDTIANAHGLTRVHLLVGDAEGGEPEVLEGARETLKITEYVSVCASAERCGERTLESCEAILRAAGFDILHREETGFGTLIGRNGAISRMAA